MTWNYRVLKFVDETGEVYFAIHEVFYQDLKPVSYGHSPALILSENVDGLKWSLNKMAEATLKPVIDSSDLTKEVVE